MKFIQVLRDRLSGLFDAVFRYPVTVIFLLAAAFVVARAVNQGSVQYRYLLTFIVGASLGFTMQAIWERFFEKPMQRMALMGISVLMTGGYFFIVQPSTTTSWETWIRTAVALFALAMAYIWVPSIKSKLSFNDSFMVSFKSFFGSLLFSGVLFFGANLILLAIGQLLIPLSEPAIWRRVLYYNAD